MKLKKRGRNSQDETFAECSILFKFKEGENFNGSTELAEDRRNILDILRIKI